MSSPGIGGTSSSIWPRTERPIARAADSQIVLRREWRGQEFRESGDTHRFEPGDVVYIPQQVGLVVSWDTPSYGKFAYVTYPHWR